MIKKVYRHLIDTEHLLATNINSKIANLKITRQSLMTVNLISLRRKSEMLRKMSYCDQARQVTNGWVRLRWWPRPRPPHTDMQEIRLIHIHSFLYLLAELNFRFWAESCVSVTSSRKIFYNSRLRNVRRGDKWQKIVQGMIFLRLFLSCLKMKH